MTYGNAMRWRLLGCAALVLLAGIPQARAQIQPVAAPAPDQASVGLEEITVTARRREEKLQDVPTAIAALNYKELTDRQILQVEDLGTTIPSVHIVPQNGTANIPQISIRGVTGGNLNAEVDSPIAMYIDGVYLARSGGASFDLADLERVEVLRGPQGTLFGRNSEAGAIHFISKAPTGEFGGHLETTFGNYNLRRVKATVDLPEFDNISLRISALHTERDGYIKNTTPGVTVQVPQPFGPQVSTKTLGDDDETGVMVAARYTSDNLIIDYKFDFTSQYAEAEAQHVVGFDTGAFGKTIFDLQPLVGGQNVFGPGYRSSLPALTSDDHFMIYGHNLTAEYTIDDTLSLKSITAYRMVQEGGGFNTNEGDIIIAPFTVPGTGLVAGEISCLLCSIPKRSQHQISEELQLIGTEEKFDYIGGLYFFDERAFQNDVAYILKSFQQTAPNMLNPGPLTPADYLSGSLNRAQNRSVAAYLHGTFHVTDSFDIAGGLRHTEDRRYAGYWTTTVHATPGQEFLPPGPGGTFSKDFSHTDYEITGTYKLFPDVNIYGRVATGYVSGGVLHGHDYDPTTNTTYEMGLKSEWLDHKLRLNVALFEEDQTNLQVLQFNPNFGVFFINSGNNHTHGIEIEASYVPIAGLTLAADFGYDHFGESNGFRTPQPDTTLFLSAEYRTQPLWNGIALSARLDGNYQSRYTQYQNPAADPVLDAQLFTPAFWQMDARVSALNIPMGTTSGRVSIWGKNLTDARYLNYTAPFGLYIPGQYMAPRTFGADLSVEF
ncbi:MAG: Catecholate siderophore receptor Fiu [Rhodospirillales bacterium]|nr:Catecholate siderophore receptor Fiu [Rhodospirillales bacterium]